MQASAKTSLLEFCREKLKIMQKKVIVITGASSGIGQATARLLASQGNEIVLAARREERLQKMTADIKANGGEAVYQVTDVTKMSEIQALADKAIETYGRIDVWVNNAGLMPLSELVKGKTDEWEQMIDTNLKGTLYGIHAALPQMRKQNGGQFVNIGSVSSHIPTPAGGVYAATKFGVRALSESLRQEEAAARSNVRVTLIAPGAIDTELPKHVTDKANSEAMDEFYKGYAIPAERVAECIAFAVNMPENTSINEILLRPTAQVL